MTRDIRYEGRIFRPPSEAYSLIIQSTIGCSQNGCAFCSMYKEKRFRIRKTEDVLADISAAREIYGPVRRVFLADGDALMRDTQSQLEILGHIFRVFPKCERVSSYASPKSVLLKTDEELFKLRGAGLKMAYIGLESGSDAVLERMNKGSAAADTVLAGRRLKAAGITTSVTAIVGLAGAEPEAQREHAIATGRAFSQMKPDYIGLLSLMMEPEAPLYDEYKRGAFIVPDAAAMLKEIRLMLKNTDSEGSVFRANHASNYVNLAGTLNMDSIRLISEIDAALGDPRRIKDEWWRGL